MRRTAGPDTELTVPVGVAHRWWNTGEGPALIRVELAPALDTETFFETFFGLARDGCTTRRGLPTVLAAAVLFDELGDSCPYLAALPVAMARLGAAALAPLARRLGLRAVYPSYSPGHHRAGPS